MFLFDTHRDFDSIDLLLQLFRSANRTALALPLESELRLVCDTNKSEAIAAAFPDLKLYRLSPSPKQ